MRIRYKINNEVSAADLIAVFTSVGWNKDPKDIVQAFKKSYYITAYADEALVGFARAISDGYYYTGIYDVVVRPSNQNQGIAKTMMQMLLREFKGSYFFLSYTEGNRPFYVKCGFEDLATGMWIDKGKQPE